MTATFLTKRCDHKHNLHLFLQKKVDERHVLVTYHLRNANENNCWFDYALQTRDPEVRLQVYEQIGGVTTQKELKARIEISVYCCERSQCDLLK